MNETEQIKSLKRDKRIMLAALILAGVALALVIIKLL